MVEVDKTIIKYSESINIIFPEQPCLEKVLAPNSESNMNSHFKSIFVVLSFHKFYKKLMESNIPSD